MKKSLLAVAAMTAFAGAAQAQSSVTVYGILDVGYIGGNQKGATTTGTNSSQTINQLGSSAESSSRLGFKGTEDLGGGMSAFFTVEVDVTATNADAFSNFGSASNRQAFVGLAKKGVGKGAIGTQYTPIHTAVAATDAAQANNVIGNVIYPRNSGLGGVNSNPNGSSIGYTLRTNNAITFNSEKMAGVGVNLFYNMANSNQNQTTTGTPATVTGGTNNTSGYGISADYNIKKFYVTAAYQSFKSEIDATTAGAAQTATALTSGILANTTDNQFYAGATYDFGILKAYAQYLNRKATGVVDSNEYASRSAQQIGVRSFLTPKVEAWVSGGTGRYQAYGVGEPTANFTGYQLGSNYWLSKRTNLYAIFGSNSTSSTTNTSNYQTSYNGNNYAVGVRHTF
jgi:predicted porin